MIERVCVVFTLMFNVKESCILIFEKYASSAFLYSSNIKYEMQYIFFSPQVSPLSFNVMIFITPRENKHESVGRYML